MHDLTSFVHDLCPISRWWSISQSDFSKRSATKITRLGPLWVKSFLLLAAIARNNGPFFDRNSFVLQSPREESAILEATDIFICLQSVLFHFHSAHHSIQLFIKILHLQSTVILGLAHWTTLYSHQHIKPWTWIDYQHFSTTPLL